MTLTKSRASEIRRQLRADGCVDKLYVNLVGDVPWVASKYWAAPLGASVAGLLIDSSEPAAYALAANDKNDPVVKLSDTPPNLAMVIPKYETHVALEPLYVLDKIRVHDDQGHPLFMVNGVPLAVDLDYVACVSPGEIRNGSERPNWHREPRVILKGESNLKPVSVWRESSYSHVEKGKQVTLTFAGIVMPIRVG